MGEQTSSNIANGFFNISSATMREYLESKGEEWEAGTVYGSESLFRGAMSELTDIEQQQIEKAMSVFLQEDESIIFRIMIAIVQDIGAFEKQQSEKGEKRGEYTINDLHQKGLGAQLLLKYYNGAYEKREQSKQRFAQILQPECTKTQSLLEGFDSVFIHDIAVQFRSDLASLPQQFVSAIKKNFSATSASFEDFKNDDMSSKKVKPPEKIKTEVISRGGGNKSGIGAGVAIVTLLGLGILLVLSGGKKE